MITVYADCGRIDVTIIRLQRNKKYRRGRGRLDYHYFGDGRKSQISLASVKRAQRAQLSAVEIGQ